MKFEELEHLSSDFLDKITGNRATKSRKPTVDWRALIDRKVSHVRIEGKIYRVEVTERKPQK